MPLRFEHVDSVQPDSKPAPAPPPTAILSMLPQTREHATEVFLEHGNHMPMVFCNHGDHVAVYAMPSPDNETKTEMAKQLRRWAKEGKLLEFCFVCEAWLGSGKAAQLHQEVHGTIEGSVNCEEGLTLMYESPTHVEVWVAKIHRDPLRVDEWEANFGQGSVEPPTRVEGRFGSLWSHTEAKDGASRNA